jgi:prevent-host-death family protein
MARAVNIGLAKDQLSRLVDAAKGGEDVVIMRAGKPQARLVPILDDADARRAALAAKLASAHGAFRGKIDMSLDWEAPSMTGEEVARWGLGHPWTDDD